MTETEQYIASEIASHLRQGESPIAFATLQDPSSGGMLSAMKAKGYLAALTDQRIILIETRIGAFKVLQENRGVTFIERAAISAVAITDIIIVQLSDGSTRHFQHQSRVGKYAATEQSFRDTLHAPYSQSIAAADLARTHKLKKIGGLVLGLVLAGLYIGYRAYWGKAEVEVECRGQKDGLACELRHIGGGADAHACWDVTIKCKNGVRAKSKRTCADVEPDQGVTVKLDDSKFANIDKCEEPTGMDVRHLIVK